MSIVGLVWFKISACHVEGTGSNPVRCSTKILAGGTTDHSGSWLVSKPRRLPERADLMQIIRSKILQNVDSHPSNACSQLLTEDSQALIEHSQALTGDSQALTKHSQALNEDSQLLTGHSQLLTEDSQLLTEDSQPLNEDSQVKN
jgi:hypothetical protein